MKAHHLAWVLVPLLLGGAAYMAQRNGSGLLAFVQHQAILDCPKVLQLGERELGEVAISEFTIANRGRGTLEITDVQSSCSCTGMEQEVNGDYIRVKSLRLRAGEQAELVMRVLVQGTPGIPARNGVRFLTNDPDNPEAAIEVEISRVKAGVSTVPASVVFGTCALGADARQVIDVFDSSATPRAIARVMSRNPARVAVRLLSPSPDLPKSHNNTLENLIGRVEISAHTQLSGPLTDEIEIYLRGEDRPPTVVEVSGRVAEEVEIVPSTLVLPRIGDTGKVYVAECVCRSTNGKPFTLIADPLPAGLTAQLPMMQQASLTQTVRNGWNPAQDRAPADPHRKVRLRASINGRETVIEIRVFCKQEDA